MIGGGLVSFWGPVIGVVVFLTARDVIGALTNAWMLYFGLLFMGLVLFKPEGIAGMAQSAFARRAFRACRPCGASFAFQEQIMAFLEAKGVHVRFGDRVVLEQIDLSVQEGELHGIMGPNGAGKTTFFNALTGRVKLNRGCIRLDGETIGGLSAHAIARKGVARSFQIMTLFDEFTVRENVMVALPSFRERGFETWRAVEGNEGFSREADEILASVGLDPQVHHPGQATPLRRTTCT